MSRANLIAKELYLLGMTLLQSGKIREAAFQFKKALVAHPHLPDALLALGHCLHSLSAFEEALAAYDRLLAASPDSVAGWNNRGNTLLEMNRFEEAAESYARALQLSPSLHDCRVALATCYQALGRPDMAMDECTAVLEADPSHAEAHWNRALLLLQSGDFGNGWREYEWRWRKRNFTSPRRAFHQPLWQGEALAGKTILIHAEQGFGDTLQFCRYVPLVSSLGGRVIFECHPPLTALMQTLAGNPKIVPMGEPLPEFDLQAPLLSLPMLCGTTLQSIPGATPYLSPPADRLPHWVDIARERGNIKVGICWAGKSYPDPRRSCPPAQLAALGEIEHVSLYSLQMGWNREVPLPMTDHTGRLHDFGDTAAFISSLDLVISVDTAVAHLAGALGKPTWVMLPYASDWRWLVDRADSPWYPTMRLFRQTRPDSWNDVAARVVRELRNKLPHHR